MDETMTKELKKTALNNSHKKLGGKLIEFAGWELPVQYEGILEEHAAVRNAAGIFDVSHMGEVKVQGEEAFDFVQNLITNDLNKINDNGVLYSLMCYEDGGVVDDLLIYRYAKNNYLLVINASNVEKDYEWMLKNVGNYKVSLKNISNEISEVALQGPKAHEILQNLTKTNLDDIKFFTFKDEVLIEDIKCLVSRTGYTGEDGFEIYTANKNIESVWNMVLDKGRSYGIKPAGLGSRDTLRFEAALPLYGNEISKDITPLEAGLSFFVSLNKENFLGKEALVKQKSDGLKRKLVGFTMVDRGIPRHGYKITKEGKEIGFVTTGYMSPTLKENIGIALISAEYASIGTEIEISIRNKSVKAVVRDKKFYAKNYKR